MDHAEREIRNGVVDILCFLSSGKATEADLLEIEKRISLAVEVVRQACDKENVEA